VDGSANLKCLKLCNWENWFNGIKRSHLGTLLNL
jgi:hypothetical protein